MNILIIPTIELNKFDEYLNILNEGTIILNGGRTNSGLFDKWLNENNITDILYRGGYNPASDFVDYHYFYKKNEEDENYNYSVKALVEKNI